MTLPGYGFHAIRGRSAISQRIEWQSPIPVPSIPLGRYGRVPAQLIVAPFVVLAWTDARSLVPMTAPRRFNPAVGLAGIGLFDLLRIDVARGLRDGRWMFSTDLSRDFWRIL